jgi:hypothetical protein
MSVSVRFLVFVVTALLTQRAAVAVAVERFCAGR